MTEKASNPEGVYDFFFFSEMVAPTGLEVDPLCCWNTEMKLSPSEILAPSAFSLSLSNFWVIFWMKSSQSLSIKTSRLSSEISLNHLVTLNTDLTMIKSSEILMDSFPCMSYIIRIKSIFAPMLHLLKRMIKVRKSYVLILVFVTTGGTNSPFDSSNT